MYSMIYLISLINLVIVPSIIKKKNMNIGSKKIRILIKELYMSI